jgi:serine O-acetyltransferase
VSNEANRELPAMTTLTRAFMDVDAMARHFAGRLGVRPEDAVELFQTLREDLTAHGNDWSRAGFQALAVYRLGVWRMRIGPRWLRAPFSLLWRVMFETVRNVYGIELPYSAKIGRRVVFEHQHGIVVHGDTVIGDECIIRQGVTLGIRRLDRLGDAPVLGRGVNVGAGAKILGKLTVGDHAEIGANAVVLDDVPPGAIAVGVPARITRRRPQPPLEQPRSRRHDGNGIGSTRVPPSHVYSDA